MKLLLICTGYLVVSAVVSCCMCRRLRANREHMEARERMLAIMESDEATCWCNHAESRGEDAVA